MESCAPRRLIFIATYNERANVGPLITSILGQDLACDILFIDDDSPDGTGAILDDFARGHPEITVIHRAGKQGIGTAHAEGIAWAYAHGYEQLVTMDADFAHPPEYLPEFFAAPAEYPIVVGSRYMRRGSLVGWSLPRRILTRTGHFLTTRLLRMPYDATGAFRRYRLDRIPAGVFDLVRSPGYAFFFESLYVLHMSGFAIHEAPIHLPSRTYGDSKMDLREMVMSLRLLLVLALTRSRQLRNHARAEAGSSTTR